MYNQKDILNFLVNSLGKSAVLENGIVTYKGTPTPLPETYEGWMEIVLMWQRDGKGQLSVRTFSLPLAFIMTGAEIIRNEWLRFNIDRALYLVIKRLFVESVGLTKFKIYYKQLYKGQLDLSTIKDAQDEGKLECNIMEGGLYKLLKAQENTKFVIPFDDDTVFINDDGIELHKRVTWTVPPDIEISNTTIEDFAVPTATIGVDGVTSGVVLFDQQFEQVNDLFDYLANSPNYLLTLSENFSHSIDVTIKGVIKITCTKELASGGQLQMRLFKQDGTWAGNGGQPFANGLQRDPDQFGNMLENVVYTFTIDEVCTMNPGDKIFLIGKMFATIGGAVEFKIKFIQGTEFYISFQVREDATQTAAHTPYNLAKKLIGKITGNENDFASDLLPLCNILVTCGTAIRGDQSVGILTSWSSFCKSFDVYLKGSYGVSGGKIRFERRDFAYDKTTVIPLGEARDWSDEPAIDYMGSRIKIGHAEQTLSDVNSKFDFNGFGVYKTPILSLPDKEIDLQSDYKAGPYEQEEIRINLEGKTTTSADTDNDVYVKQCLPAGANTINQNVGFVSSLNAIITGLGPQIFVGQTIQIIGSTSNDGVYKVLGVANIIFGLYIVLDGVIIDTPSEPVTIQILKGQMYNYDRTEIPTAGVPSPETVYNVSLRISKIFEIHQDWFRSWLYNYEPGQVEFVSNNINSALVVDGKADNRNFNISEMGTRMFKPVIIEASPLAPVDLIETFEATPNASFSIIHNSVLYSGYLLRGGLAPNSRRTQIFRLLLWDENDVTKLI